ncbi:MAG: Na+/H+ antiporter NhaA [Ferruginibacter sp.]|nr:Na+/H+ antiporter NhaA [Ferruginibacter sp.]
MKRIQVHFRRKIIDPFLDFIHDSRSVGIILLLCTAVSLLLANTSFAVTYFSFINIDIPVTTIIPVHLPHTLQHWINDGLMAVFFFLAGMEIKREITGGELSSFSQAILPLLAAIGGMVVPALIFFFINNGTNYTNGWGIPMATDIAFSLGIAALLGSRIPLGLKIFLTALAIIDDLGAILAIAIFYSAAIHWIYLGIAAIIIFVLYLLMRFNNFGIFNFLLGILLWYCFYNSGIHATLAGVIFAFFIPTNQLQKLEQKLHTSVNFLIIPIFALANTAIVLPENITVTINTTLSWGIIAGLLIGKPLGIVSASYVAVQLKWGTLPSNTSWRHIIGAGLLAGIGFTMSIFIATLAFEDNVTIDIAKISALAGSFLSIVFGIIWIRFFCKPLLP